MTDWDGGHPASMRVSYDLGTLAEGDLAVTPLQQFQKWFNDAREAVFEPNAMVLATSTSDSQPSTRTVLLKDADARGFVFFTNLHSRKSRELHANPAASCVFPWLTLHRQVVVVGRAELLAREEVEDYWSTRPRGSQLGAWASRQSTTLDGRTELDERYAQLQQEYPEGVRIPVPDHWGGWLIRPRTVEFWQGRESRLHDRLLFTAQSDPADLSSSDWTITRLSP